MRRRSATEGFVQLLRLSLSNTKLLEALPLEGLGMVYWDLSWKAGQRDVR